MKTIYFFRHGLTDWNKQKRLQGHTDIPLNDEGRSQAASLKVFFDQNPVDKVFSSDLGRAIETAHIATGVQKEEIILHPGFKEAKLGSLEGMHEDDIIKLHGEDALSKWRSLDDEHRHFAFPGAESRQQCNDRLFSALWEVCHNHEFDVAAICSHGFAMRRLFHHIANEKVVPPLIANCVIHTVQFDSKNKTFSYQLLQTT